MVGAVFWGMVALCLLTALVSATVVGALYLFGRTVLSGWLELR